MSIQNALAGATSNIVNATISANVKKQKEADKQASLEAKQQKEEQKRKEKRFNDGIKRSWKSLDKDVSKLSITPITQYTEMAPLVAEQSLERVKMLANQKMMLMDAKARAKFRNKARKGGK